MRTGGARASPISMSRRGRIKDRFNNALIMSNLQSHLHQRMGRLIEGCYTADWDGKVYVLCRGISPLKTDEFLWGAFSTNDVVSAFIVLDHEKLALRSLVNLTYLLNN